jgi:hypothetical protein
MIIVKKITAKLIILLKSYPNRRLLNLFIGLFLFIAIMVSGAYIVKAVTGQAPYLTPADNWDTVNLGVDPGSIITESLWNGLVNEANARAKIDFSVAGYQKNITCTNSRRNFRATAPGPGVKAGIFNFYKTGGLDVRARFYTTGGKLVTVLFSDSSESHCDCSVSAMGDYAIIPVDSQGYFACESIPSNRGTNADIQITLIGYIY